MKLFRYVSKLANLIQDDWEASQYLFYRDLSVTAPSEVTRRNCLSVLNYMAEGLHDFRRNYRAVDSGNEYRIIYDCNVTGMRKIHCVVNKETGDLARFSTQLVNEASFQYNLNDPRSREAAFSIADYDGNYLL